MPTRTNKPGSPSAVLPATAAVKSRPPGPVAKPVVARTAAASVQPRPDAGKAASAEKPDKDKAKARLKLVRDSFTIPRAEYAVLLQLKERAITLARPAKKSELLRAGIAALQALNDKAFLAALDAVPSLKTGRPKAAAGTGRKLG